MQKFYIILTFILIAGITAAQNLKPVAQRVSEKKSQSEIFKPEQLFGLSSTSLQRSTALSATVSNATILNFSTGNAAAVVSTRPENILFVIPTNSGTNLELELYRSTIFTPDFTVVTSSSNGQAVPYTGGVHYWGIIKGDNASTAAISIFNDEVMGMISSASGNLILGKLKNDPDGNHILYNEHDLKALPPTQCFTPDDNGTYKRKELQNPAKVSVNCIRLYWEVNYDIFLDKGSVTAATNYVTGLFNESAIIYTNDAIPVGLSQVYVWTGTSPYTSTSTSGLLNQFQQYCNSFNGDLGHLLGYAGGGGVAAGFNGLCASNLDNSQCYSGIHSTYSNVPVFSWSVEVVTHEQGHLMGSRHTHACVWNGNNTAIDGCGPSAGYPYEGACSGAPIPPTGGTIMSYCHLVAAGINFNNGFGPQPAAVILNNYNNAICLTSCSGISCFAPVNTSTTAVTTTTATFNWTAVTGALSYNIQYRIIGAPVWSTGTSGTNSYNAIGLTPGSNYEWQVQTVCSGGTSAYTNSANFITIPLTCNVPSNTTTINITSFSASFNWNAVPGAVSYTIQYRIVGAPVWTTGTSATTSYNATGLTPNTNYEWQVMTVCVGGGTSAFSSSVNFITLAIGQVVTIVLQPDEECGKDAIIAGCVPCGYSTINFGDSPEFNVISWTNGGSISDSRALIQFDLTAIPAGSSIQSAFLSLYFDSTSSNIGHSQMSGANDAYIQKITAPWDEHTVTWVNQPGISVQNQVYMPPSSSPTQDYTNMDITAMIQDFVNNPAANYGMIVKLITETPYRSLIFCSSDHPGINTHPKLEITYAPNTSGCASFQYSNCNGIDALIGNNVPHGYDTTNFGGNPEFDAVAWTAQGIVSNLRSLIYWNLASIPTNATVTSATLSLYYNPNSSNAQGFHSSQSGPDDAYIRKITSPWDEYIVTWNTQPTTTALDQAYLPQSTSTTQDYTNMDVTVLVQDMVANPATNYGLMVQLVTESYYRGLLFCSSDHPDPAKHPKLDICYTVPVSVQDVQNINHLSVVEDFANEMVTVKSPVNFMPGTSLRIYNAAGQLVRIFDNLTGNTFIFNGSHLSGGIYVYQLVSNKEILNGKLIFR